MTNRDLVCFGLIAIFLVFIWSIMRKFPQHGIVNREPPLPINLYTNGVRNGNTNDVANRVNFQQQPVGGNYS